MYCPGIILWNATRHPKKLGVTQALVEIGAGDLIRTKEEY
jgi:hypothetical protein